MAYVLEKRTEEKVLPKSTLGDLAVVRKEKTVEENGSDGQHHDLFSGKWFEMACNNIF